MMSVLSCCTVQNLSCVPCQPGVAAAECGWSGWLNGSECVLNMPREIESCATDSLSCMDWEGECVPSVYGVRCAECDFKGYMSIELGLECICYDIRWNPRSHCSSRFFDTYERTTVSVITDSVHCVPFQSRELGCFKQLNLTRYGDPDPVTPHVCCSEIYGPPPGQLVEDGSNTWQECNTYGTTDPNEPFAIGAFRTCSGHGRWDTTTYSCECFSPWNALVIGQDHLTGDDVYSCRACFGFWGPHPPLDSSDDEVPVLFCGVIMVPDEDGELAECGGHGVYQDGACVCDFDATLGYWGLAEVSHVFERVFGNGTMVEEVHTVQACIVCSSGVETPGCPVAVNTTVLKRAPLPTTLAPATVCITCPLYGNRVLTNVEFMPMAAVISDPGACCTINRETRTKNELRIWSGSCISTVYTKRHFGALTCQQLAGCVAYTWTTHDQYTGFKFTTEMGFGLVLSVSSESGRPCGVTKSPTTPTTLYPTSS